MPQARITVGSQLPSAVDWPGPTQMASPVPVAFSPPQLSQTTFRRIVVGWLPKSTSLGSASPKPFSEEELGRSAPSTIGDGALGAAAVSDAAGGAVAVVAGVVTDAVGEGGAGAAGVGVLAAGAAQEAREMMRSAATPLRGCLMPRFCQASGFAAWLSLGGCGVAQ